MSQPSYIICSTVRSGSTLLARTLSGLDGCGQPEESFHRHIIRQKQLNQSSKKFIDYCQAIVEASVRKDDALGIKLHWWQLRDFLMLARQAADSDTSLSDLAVLEQFFPNLKFVYLSREDRAAQAVSAAIASQTGLWEKNVSIPAPTAKFQPWKIYEWETALTEQHQNWQTFFQQNSITPYQLTYEQLVSAFSQQISQIVEYLDLPVTPSPDDIDMPVQRQANANNQRLIKQYQQLPKPLSAASLWLYRQLKPSSQPTLTVSSPQEKA
ncbi:MAG: Stf0 family sulfotransferase [Phormidesmis sp.]